jgi:hypothetical protein
LDEKLLGSKREKLVSGIKRNSIRMSISHSDGKFNFLNRRRRRLQTRGNVKDGRRGLPGDFFNRQFLRCYFKPTPWPASPRTGLLAWGKSLGRRGSERAQIGLL